MAKDLKTYYDFADNNFNFLIAAYEQGLVGNAMGAMAQETCEKYLKHIIEEYIVPNDSKNTGRNPGTFRRTEKQPPNASGSAVQYVCHASGRTLFLLFGFQQRAVISWTEQ